MDDQETAAHMDEKEPVLAFHPATDRMNRSFNDLVDPRTAAFDPDSTREIIRVLIRLKLKVAENG